jgi:hypothetical protein
VLPDGEPAQIKIEEMWLLPAVLELVLEEYEVHHVSIMAVLEDDWCKLFFDYSNHDILSNDHVKRRRLQHHLTMHILKAEVLYQRSFGQEVISWCVSRKEVDQILLEMHKGVSDGHQNRAKIYHSIKIVG